jgi:hypothetical protein
MLLMQTKKFESGKDLKPQSFYSAILRENSILEKSKNMPEKVQCCTL